MQPALLPGASYPVDLLMHGFDAVLEALLNELRSYTEDRWLEPAPPRVSPVLTIGSLAEYVMTVPRMPSYWHAAIHLDKLAKIDATHEERAAGSPRLPR